MYLGSFVYTRLQVGVDQRMQHALSNMEQCCGRVMESYESQTNTRGNSLLPSTIFRPHVPDGTDVS